MKPIVFFLCVFALLTLALTCIAADRPQTVDWTLSTSLTSPICPTSPTYLTTLQSTRPVAPVGRIAIAPVRAVLQARPLRQVGAAISSLRPIRRVGKAVDIVVRARPLARPLARLVGLRR